MIQIGKNYWDLETCRSITRPWSWDTDQNRLFVVPVKQHPVSKIVLTFLFCKFLTFSLTTTIFSHSRSEQFWKKNNIFALTSNLLLLPLLDVDYEPQNQFGVMPIGPRVHHGDHDGLRDGRHDGLRDGLLLGGLGLGGHCWKGRCSREIFHLSSLHQVLKLRLRRLPMPRRMSKKRYWNNYLLTQKDQFLC